MPRQRGTRSCRLERFLILVPKCVHTEKTSMASAHVHILHTCMGRAVYWACLGKQTTKTTLSNTSKAREAPKRAQQTQA
eukprot:8042824-Alexandrium_andersonii.AAC.1